MRPGDWRVHSAHVLWGGGQQVLLAKLIYAERDKTSEWWFKNNNKDTDFDSDNALAAESKR